MRRIRYQVACSLDGYIAGPKGEYDWIVMDPEIDFAALFNEFDTLLMGRRTFEVTGVPFPGMKVVVFSRTLRQTGHPEVTIVSDHIEESIHELRAQPGKDIWLFGGGELFRSLLALGCVDTVEPAIIPVLLGGGRPFLPAPSVRRSLVLTGQKVYKKTGTVLLTYDVARSDAKKRARKGKARTT
ncbi:MAG: dihydrofolate reductase family protein [Gemmatimonadaceae bacterium]